MANSPADLDDVHALLMVVDAGRELVAASGYHQGAGCYVPLSLPGGRRTIWLHHCAYLPQVGVWRKGREEGEGGTGGGTLLLPVWHLTCLAHDSIAFIQVD